MEKEKNKEVKLLENLNADELRQLTLEVLKENAQLKTLTKEINTSSVEIKHTSKGATITVKTYSNDLTGVKVAYKESLTCYRQAIKDLKLTVDKSNKEE